MAEPNLLWVLVIFLGLGVFIFTLSSKPKRRTFDTPEEESAYRREMAKQRAIEDSEKDRKGREWEEKETRKYPFGRSLFFDDFRRKSKRRK